MAPVFVGLLAGFGVLIAFLAVAGGADLTARLERYVGGQPTTDASGGLGRLLRLALPARLAKLVERRRFGTRLTLELLRADVVLRPAEFMAIWLAVAVGLPVAVLALSPAFGWTGNPLPVVLALGIGIAGPRMWLSRRQTKRLRAFEAHLADTTTLLANGLRAGSSFLQSIELIVGEAEPPVSVEFQRLLREVNVGVPLEDALHNLQRRVPSPDLGLMTTAISIQNAVGGNLAEILDSIGATIRERTRIHGEIRVLTAQQRLSGYVVGGLPAAIVAILAIVSPRYLEPLFQKPPEALGLPMGVLLLAAGGLVALIGFAIIRRIVDIKV